MARLWTSGAEWNDATAEGVTLGAGTTITTTNPRSGTYCYTGNSGTDVRFLPTGVLGTTYYLRGYYYFQDFAAAANNPTLLAFDTRVPAVMARLLFSDTGAIQLVQGSGSTLVATSAPVAKNTWVRLELSLLLGTGSVDAVEGLVDGVSFGSATGLNISDTLTWRASAYLPGLASGVNYVDDIALNDSTGAAQNTWPGSGKVVLLAPASDNAKGTGWTNDAAATTNLFDAVNNEPPVGIADTTGGSGLNQLRNATSNANVNYDANLTTYAAAGVGASDTVNVLVPVVATGAPVTTSAKAGTYGISANPVIANVALGAAGTAGAFWQGNAAGTYPTGWKWSFGTTTYAPTVTLGTAPVARITQVTASTRIAMVCAMGMYVDYTPGVSALPPLPVYVDSAVARSTSY